MAVEGSNWNFFIIKSNIDENGIQDPVVKNREFFIYRKIKFFFHKDAHPPSLGIWKSGWKFERMVVAIEIKKFAARVPPYFLETYKIWGTFTN